MFFDNLFEILIVAASVFLLYFMSKDVDCVKLDVNFDSYKDPKGYSKVGFICVSWLSASVKTLLESY